MGMTAPYVADTAGNTKREVRGGLPPAARLPHGLGPPAHRMTFLRHFLYILAAALGAALVGGLFAAGIAVISPEFVKGLFVPPADASLPRYAAAVGAIWGVFIGAGVMGFCLGLATLVQVARMLTRRKDGGEPPAP